MRRALLALSAVGSLLAGLVGLSLPANAAITEGLVVDLDVGVTSTPTTVSPPGSNVEYLVTVSNASSVGTEAEVTIDVANGSLADADERCEGTTCTVDVPANGSTAPIQLVVTTSGVVSDPEAPETWTTVAVEVQPVPVSVVDLNQDNNTASASTQETEKDGSGGSIAFLRDEESFRFKTHTLTVKEVYGTAEGIVAAMKDADGTGRTCGTALCAAEALNVAYTDGGEGGRFEGLVEIDVFFQESDPCRGLGSGSACWKLFYQNGPVAQEVPQCPTPLPGEEMKPASKNAGPCLKSVTKQGELFHQVIRMFTADPDILQQAKELAPVKG